MSLDPKIVSTHSKEYWEEAVAQVEINAAHSLNVPDTKAASKAAKTFNITYAPNWWDWSTHNTTIINYAPSQKDQQQKEADRAKCIGSIVSLASAVAVGLFSSSFLKARKALNLTEKRLDKTSKLDEGISKPLRNLFHKQHKIETRNYANARDKLLSTVTILAGGASAIAGGFMISSALITAGYAAMIFGGIALLFSVGYHWSDQEANQKNAYQIVGYEYKGKFHEGLAEKARYELCRYDDHMSRIREEGEPEHYVPLYAEGEVPTRPSAPVEVEGQAPTYQAPSAPEVEGQIKGATA